MLNEMRSTENSRNFCLALRLAVPLLVVLCFTLPFAARVEEAVAPSAATILDRYVEATGGKDAYDKVSNSVTKSTVEMPAQGMTLDMTVYHARPGLAYVVIESEALGRIEKGTNGEIAWEKSVMTGPRILEGQEKEDLVREATFDRMVRWREIYEKAESAGTEDVAGHTCDKVVLTPKTGQPQTLYFNRATGLISKVAFTVESPMGVVSFESYPEDYRKVEGLLIPFRTRIDVLGQERLITVQSVEQNVEMPEGRFDLPADILALLN